MVRIEQIYTGCLAHAAYIIESDGEAAVIDPLREPHPYIDKVKEMGATIKYVFETHFHADFVSGHVDLATETGAAVVFGPTAQPGFPAIVATDGQVFKLGKVTIEVLHTPGHTLESSTFLLYDEEGHEKAIFTGDTLFIGDVGRPDLAQKLANMTQEDLARLLYKSLREKIMPLPDEVIVYPAHGAGSACGKNMSSETFDILGNQKNTNYALRENMTADEFVVELTTGLTAPPEYFPINVGMNKGLNMPFTAIMERGRTKLNPDAFEAAMKNTTPKPLVIDTRDTPQYTEGHIPGSVFCGIDGGFAPNIGTAFPELHRPVLVVAKDPSRVDEIITRLARIGHDNCIGHLDGGFAAWVAAGKPVEKLENITPDELADRLAADPNLFLVDVRRPPEVARAGCTRAVNIPLAGSAFPNVDTDKNIIAFCAGGYRSVIFLSAMLHEHGLQGKAINVVGGFWAIETCEKMKPYVRIGACPNSLKQKS